MYAGAAVGVSHLVQATRAGAGYGFALAWAGLVFLTGFSILYLVVRFKLS